MALTRTITIYHTAVTLTAGQEVSYRLEVPQAAHPTWSFGCNERRLTSSAGAPKDIYEWTLAYADLDVAGLDVYTVSMAFLGQCKYRLLVTLVKAANSTSVLQDITYVNDSGTDYFPEALDVTKG